MVVMDRRDMFTVSGTGDIIESDDRLAAVGSGAGYALAAGRALYQNTSFPAEEICRIWLKANGNLLGDHVEMVPEYRWGWTHVSHFFKRPFYCYSYIFGNLVSICAFQNYLKQGRDFANRMGDALSSGGSRAPLELLSVLDLDPKETHFWEIPLQYISDLIDAFQRQVENPH